MLKIDCGDAELKPKPQDLKAKTSRLKPKTAELKPQSGSGCKEREKASELKILPETL